MGQLLQFVKMVGTGNDFIMIDNRELEFCSNDKDLITKLCDRRKGIGSDGIILVESSNINDFKMRIINPDGSEVDMCGNGARCAVKFAQSLGMIKDNCTVETIAGELLADIKENNIRLNMGNPKDYRERFIITFNGCEYGAYFVNTGVPHVVIFSQNIDEVDVYNFGKFVRYHELFHPNGTNCNFVQIIDKNNIKVRTYERGVENETFSCGTGTCASAIISVTEKNCCWPVISTTPLGEILNVDSILNKNNPDEPFYLEGPVKTTFSGSLKY